MGKRQSTVLGIAPLEWVLRLGVALTFLGHGMLAYQANPSWVVYLKTTGLSKANALALMPYIGLLDILVALLVLIKPYHFVVIWAVFWAFSTALIRPISGEPIWALIERGANWACPLALLVLQNLDRNRTQ